MISCSRDLEEDFFYANIDPRTIHNLNEINNYIQIDGNIQPNHFFNSLMNKLINDNNHFFFEKEELKLNLINETGEEEEENNNNNDYNIQIELVKFGQGYILIFNRISGTVEDFNQKLNVIYEYILHIF